MRRISYIAALALIVVAILLAAFAPDTITLVDIAAMALVVAIGVFLGMLPLIRYTAGLSRGRASIEAATDVESDSTWSALAQNQDVFGEPTLNRMFSHYREKAQGQRSSDQVISDIADYINEDTLAIACWDNVLKEIPGTLTGLGILGTFIGLILGIRSIGFSSVKATLSSVQTLMAGINVAFYTSISGVILSILFNVIYKTLWNLMSHELDLFTQEFHLNVIPLVEEQERYRERREIRQIISLLGRLPRQQGYSSAAAEPAQSQASTSEEVLMPQILEGFRNKEFIFYIQPSFNLNTRRVIGGDVLVRWQHPRLGVVLPNIFIPILENNGYITRLDQYTWERVCETIREGIDRGDRVVPLSVNITKTDILAIDVVGVWSANLKKYRIPPRYINIQIALNAYQRAYAQAHEVEQGLIAMGISVSIDGFSGDFIELEGLGEIDADLLNVDLRYVDPDHFDGAVRQIAAQAAQLHYELRAEGIENMAQLGVLKKSGYETGSGYYFSRPLPVDEFRQMANEK